jgi:hypothetical protein
MRVFIETIGQAKRELAKVYNEYKTGKIKSENAKTRTYILRAIIEANFRYEIEVRLSELEQKLKEENELLQ